MWKEVFVKIIRIPEYIDLIHRPSDKILKLISKYSLIFDGLENLTIRII